VVGAVFARMFGGDAVRDTADSCSLAVGLSRFDVIPPDALQRNVARQRPTVRDARSSRLRWVCGHDRREM
jgi:hypothetical protein